METMREIKGRDAQKLKEMAFRFDSAFSECFDDMLLRAAIWADPKDDNIIHLKILASDVRGNFVPYIGYYQVEEDELFCDKKMAKGLVDAKAEKKAVDALVSFVSEITQMRFAISKVMVDLNVTRYYTVKIGKSILEENTVDVCICTYLDQAKDSYGFVDAKNLVGEELASF